MPDDDLPMPDTLPGFVTLGALLLTFGPILFFFADEWKGQLIGLGAMLFWGGVVGVAVTAPVNWQTAVALLRPSWEVVNAIAAELARNPATWLAVAVVGAAVAFGTAISEQTNSDAE